MFSKGSRSTFAALILFSALRMSAGSCHAQAALLLEGADGISAYFQPAGHAAVYFARICAASPTRLRRCSPGEQGAVIARYKGIAGYDWLAIPLLPYLYSVENPSSVPERVNRAMVHSLRRQYHDTHLLSLPATVPEGGRIQRGWNQLVGAAYERRIYAFRFDTTEAQDDAFIARMNAGSDRTRFSILFNNCANFSATVLNFYLPHRFGRRILPDAGLVTPRQIAWELVRYARSHPGLRLTIFEIPRIPGYRRAGRTNQSVAASLLKTGYIAPIAVLNPYVAAGIATDFLVWGRYPLPMDQAEALGPENLGALTAAGPAGGNLRASSQ